MLLLQQHSDVSGPAGPTSVAVCAGGADCLPHQHSSAILPLILPQRTGLASSFPPQGLGTHLGETAWTSLSPDFPLLLFLQGSV